ncbi:MAG: glycosyltransferase family 2 protein [Nitrososphaerales archaeon]
MEPISGTSDVTVIVPMRNEMRNVDRCITSLLGEQGISKIVVVDDNSSDGTADAVRRYCVDDNNGRVELISAPKLSGSWSGKSNACYGGALRSSSDWLLFIDADTFLSSQIVSRSLNLALAKELDAVTCFGELRCRSPWDKIAVPFYFSLLNSFIKFGGSKRDDSYFIGSFILIRRNEYFRIGGHAAVADDLVEDKALSVMAHKFGLKIEMVYAPKLVSTEWAPGFSAGIRALSREMLPQMRRNPVSSALFAAALTLLFALPMVALLLASATVAPFRNELFALGFISLCLELLITAFAGRTMQLKRFYCYSFFFMLPEIIFMAVLWLGVFRVYAGHTISWRGRVYQYQGANIVNSGKSKP